MRSCTIPSDPHFPPPPPSPPTRAPDARDLSFHRSQPGSRVIWSPPKHQRSVGPCTLENFVHSSHCSLVFPAVFLHSLHLQLEDLQKASTGTPPSLALLRFTYLHFLFTAVAEFYYHHLHDFTVDYAPRHVILLVTSLATHTGRGVCKQRYTPDVVFQHIAS